MTARTHLSRFGATLLLALSACSSSDERPADTSGGRATAGDSTQAADSGGTEKDHDEHEKEGRVTLSEAALQTAEIRVEAVRADDAARVGEDLEVPGQVVYDPSRVAVISSRVPGRIERLSVVEGNRVRAGEAVAFLYSPAYVTAQSDLQQAVRRAANMAGTPDEEGTRALVDAARRRLRLLGVSDAEVTRVASGGEPRDFLAIAAPFAGSIVEAHVLAGAGVEAGQEIFRIADLSVVDVVAEVPEGSMPLVFIGQTATIGIAAYPSLRFDGRVERLRGELNAETRTIRAVIHASNASGRLRAGMFATVQLSVPARAAAGLSSAGALASGAVLTIPETAIVSDGEKRFVFVEVGTRAFERREVAVSSLAPPGSTTPGANRMIVRSGLAVGDRVVVQGAFTLKSELAKGELGEHGH